MGSSKSLQLPAPPTYQENANLSPNITYGSDYNKGLLSGDFTGDRSWLSSLVNPNNSANSLSYAQGLLAPQFRDNIQNITNQAVANNQNTSSTFGDALAKASGDTNSAYQSILAQQAINDSNQANSNRLNLLQTGEQGLSGFTGLAQQQTNQENGFNLENYQNLVAKAIQDNQNANKANGWQQALGMISPIGHDYLQSTGINSVPGYGVADVAKIGSLFMGGGGFGSGGAGLNSGNGATVPGGYNAFLNSGASAPIPGFYARS